MDPAKIAPQNGHPTTLARAWHIQARHTPFTRGRHVTEILIVVVQHNRYASKEKHIGEPLVTQIVLPVLVFASNEADRNTIRGYVEHTKIALFPQHFCQDPAVILLQQQLKMGAHRLPIVSNSEMLERTSFRTTGSRSGKRLCKSGRLTAPYLSIKRDTIINT